MSRKIILSNIIYNKTPKNIAGDTKVQIISVSGNSNNVIYTYNNISNATKLIDDANIKLTIIDNIIKE